VGIFEWINAVKGLKLRKPQVCILAITFQFVLLIQSLRLNIQ